MNTAQRAERASRSVFLIERRVDGAWRAVRRCQTLSEARYHVTTRQFADCRIVEESRVFGRLLAQASKLFPNDVDVAQLVITSQPDTRTPEQAFADEFGRRLI